MRIAVLGLVLVLAACQDEPSFEERYSETEIQIREQAEAIEADLREEHASEAGASSVTDADEAT